jgi:hypothetical protein
MALIPARYKASLNQAALVGGLLAVTALCLSPVVSAQDRDRDRDYDRDRIARLDPGTVIPVRVNESIDVDKGDNRVYTGTVDQDVRGENGRIVIPRGATAEMMVRYAQDNDLNLDLESVVVNGQRYGIRTEQNHVEAQRDNSLVGNIIGAINGGEARGRAIRVPRGTVVTFRLSRPLEVGVADRGEDRDGHHYHDYYDRDRDRSR